LSRLWQVVLATLAHSRKRVSERNGTLDGPSRTSPTDGRIVSIPAPAPDQNKKQPRWKSWGGPLWMWGFSVVRNKMILLFVGGGLGTIARYLIGKWFNEQPWGQGFPFGTLFINVSGSFILGAAAVFILERLSPAYQNWYLLLGTGFCGDYTTFSTFEWETCRLVRDADPK
jgi:CrcB protein